MTHIKSNKSLVQAWTIEDTNIGKYEDLGSSDKIESIYERVRLDVNGNERSVVSVCE